MSAITGSGGHLLMLLMLMVLLSMMLVRVRSKQLGIALTERSCEAVEIVQDIQIVVLLWSQSVEYFTIIVLLSVTGAKVRVLGSSIEHIVHVVAVVVAVHLRQSKTVGAAAGRRRRRIVHWIQQIEEHIVMFVRETCCGCTGG
ncbi:hypothetical protein WICPIJ_008401 [Wickerhamomyces pijperi]|uniref:Uncharacterized protein n=1 Tax=Wickerhamomyces pijperi TaxID=599730 RepID=A0A9P8PZD2_WICPI|nr:hypothetical protein WICPIJ_008401 [Wickerhamomyces pijperi]